MERDDWKEGLFGGLIAGLAFLLLEMLLVPLFMGGTPWEPVRMIGAMVLGQEVLPPPASFDIGITLAALAVHLVLSAIYGVILAGFIKKRTVGSAVFIGAIFGMALYLLNFYVFAGLLFPWFAEARNWVSIVSHIAFGAAAAYAYKELKVRVYHHCVRC